MALSVDGKADSSHDGRSLATIVGFRDGPKLTLGSSLMVEGLSDPEMLGVNDDEALGDAVASDGELKSTTTGIRDVEGASLPAVVGIWDTVGLSLLIEEGRPEAVTDGIADSITTGAAEGCEDGPVEAAITGDADGCEDGASDFIATGDADGTTEGPLEAAITGESDGCRDGPPETISVGDAEDGMLDTATTGDADGLFDASTTGNSDGLLDGPPESATTGDDDGNDDSATTGARLGRSVATGVSSFASGNSGETDGCPEG